MDKYIIQLPNPGDGAPPPSGNRQQRREEISRRHEVLRQSNEACWREISGFFNDAALAGEVALDSDPSAPVPFLVIQCTDRAANALKAAGLESVKKVVRDTSLPYGSSP